MLKKDYYYENYRLTEFYDDIYSFSDDIPFWIECAANADSVLELACGTGRLTIPLAASGKNVIAVDYSEEMLNILNEKIACLDSNVKNRIRAIKDDMRYFRFKKCFDAIFITSNSLNHIESNHDLALTLHNVSSHLTEKGVFVFDILNPILQYLTRDPNGKYEEEIVCQKKTGRYFKSCESNFYDRKTQINNVRYYYNYCNEQGESIDDKTYIMDIKVRLFFPQEIEQYIKNAGFHIVAKYDYYNKIPYSGNYSEQIFILQKS